MNTLPTITADRAVDPRFVTMRTQNSGEGGLFADYVRSEEDREGSDKIESNSPFAKDVIAKAREAYEWLGIIGRPENQGAVVLPSLAVNKYETTIPQHPWSYEDYADVVWRAELAVHNTLPGVATVSVEARGKVIATVALKQGEILWMKEGSGSYTDDNQLVDDDTDFVRGTEGANKVRLVTEDGKIYEASIPRATSIDGYTSEVQATVALILKQAEAA